MHTHLEVTLGAKLIESHAKGIVGKNGNTGRENFE